MSDRGYPEGLREGAGGLGSTSSHTEASHTEPGLGTGALKARAPGCPREVLAPTPGMSHQLGHCSQSGKGRTSAGGGVLFVPGRSLLLETTAPQLAISCRQGPPGPSIQGSGAAQPPEVQGWGAPACRGEVRVRSAGAGYQGACGHQGKLGSRAPTRQLVADDFHFLRAGHCLPHTQHPVTTSKCVPSNTAHTPQRWHTSHGGGPTPGTQLDGHCSRRRPTLPPA